MRLRAGSWLYVTLALGATAGVAFASGGREPRPDGHEQTRAELAAHGITSATDDLAPLAAEVTELTSVTPLFARSTFRLPLANGVLQGAPLSSERAKSVLAIVKRELARYDKTRLAAAGLRRIVLAADLAESGKLISSLPNVAGSLLLDGTVPDAFLVRLIHHEIFHFFDFADRERLHENEGWQSDNGLFVYGEGGRSVRAARASELTDEAPGFLTGYAMSAVEEDKAEVFSLLMTRPHDVKERAHKDGVVRAKLHRVIAKLERLAPELARVAK